MTLLDVLLFEVGLLAGGLLGVRYGLPAAYLVGAFWRVLRRRGFRRACAYTRDTLKGEAA